MYVLVFTSVVEAQFEGQDVKLFATKKSAIDNLQSQYNDVCDTFDAHGEIFFGELNKESAYVHIADTELVWIIYKR